VVGVEKVTRSLNPPPSSTWYVETYSTSFAFAPDAEIMRATGSGARAELAGAPKAAPTSAPGIVQIASTPLL
jgi:hypothetical protein